MFFRVYETHCTTNNKEHLLVEGTVWVNGPVAARNSHQLATSHRQLSLYSRPWLHTLVFYRHTTLVFFEKCD